MKYEQCGKEILRGGIHYAEAYNVTAATRITFLLNVVWFFEFDNFTRLFGIKRKGIAS